MNELLFKITRAVFVIFLYLTSLKTALWQQNKHAIPKQS
ncbi:MAG: hypothetical protein RL432_1651 [Bacteroidota bacterium]|jgi:hypothetical protein